jgi:hypothetical protein
MAREPVLRIGKKLQFHPDIARKEEQGFLVISTG